MAKQRRQAAGEKAPAGRVADRGTQRRLARLEKRLARLASEEAKRARQLAEARASIDVVRERIAALGGGTAAEAAIVPPAASVDETVAGAADAPQAYCMREKRKVAIADAELVVLRNGRRAYAGTCPSCGARVIAIVGVVAAG